MTENRNLGGKPDSDGVVGDEGYDPEYFARVHGLSREQAEHLIARFGRDRKKLDAAAARLNGRYA